MICPECAADLKEYSVPNDVHTHWCEDCSVGWVLRDDKWVSIEECEEFSIHRYDGVKGMFVQETFKDYVISLAYAVIIFLLITGVVGTVLGVLGYMIWIIVGWPLSMYT